MTVPIRLRLRNTISVHAARPAFGAVRTACGLEGVTVGVGADHVHPASEHITCTECRDKITKET